MEESIAIKAEKISKVFSLRQSRTDENGDVMHEHWALKDVSFEIKKGQSVGIIGPNGSGKSTLLKILAGVTKPTSGKVSIRGRVASILDIGAGFHPELTGKENVFLNGQIHGFSKKEIQKHYDEIIAFSGIEKFIDESVKNYSNGMYLRLAFSIMVHLDFDVYLFDEVLSVGDAEFALKTKEKIRALLFSNKTIIFVSHNFNELNNMDLFIRFENGVILDNTNQADVLSRYYETSLKGGKQDIVTKNTRMTDFSKFPESQDLKIKKIELTQEEESNLNTDKEIRLTVEFEKLTGQDTLLDLAIFITDLQGSVILSSNPLLSGFSSNTDKGIYIYTCVFPAFIFGFQVYSIGLLFTNNMLSVFRELDDSLSISENNVSNDVSRMVGNTYRMDNVISFKPQFRLLNGEATKSNLNIGGGLLPIFDWNLNFEKK